jgi:hypothetical protein
MQHLLIDQKRKLQTMYEVQPTHQHEVSLADGSTDSARVLDQTMCVLLIVSPTTSLSDKL